MRKLPCNSSRWLRKLRRLRHLTWAATIEAVKTSQRSHPKLRWNRSTRIIACLNLTLVQYNSSFSYIQSWIKIRQNLWKKPAQMPMKDGFLPRSSTWNQSLIWRRARLQTKLSFWSLTSITWITVSASETSLAMRRCPPCSPSSTTSSIACSKSNSSQKVVSNFLRTC